MSDNLLGMESGASVLVEGSDFKSRYVHMPIAQAFNKVLASPVLPI